MPTLAATDDRQAIRAIAARLAAMLTTIAGEMIARYGEEIVDYQLAGETSCATRSTASRATRSGR